MGVEIKQCVLVQSAHLNHWDVAELDVESVSFGVPEPKSVPATSVSGKPVMTAAFPSLP